MTNTAAAALIAKHLPTGLPHPGNGKDHPPTLIPFPGFRTTGLPPQYADAINTTAHTIGEAIINLLETKGWQLVDATTQMAPTNTTVAGVDHTLINCNKCHKMLCMISANNEVNPATFITQVSQLDPACTNGHQPT